MDDPLSMARRDDMQQHHLDNEALEQSRPQGPSIPDIKFNIENLLSSANLMDSDSVKVLQHLLNRYVAGSPLLEEDGQLGSQTMRLVQTYRNENRYWKRRSLGEDHSPIEIDPLFTSMQYDHEVE